MTVNKRLYHAKLVPQHTRYKQRRRCSRVGIVGDSLLCTVINLCIHTYIYIDICAHVEIEIVSADHPHHTPTHPDAESRDWEGVLLL